MKSLMEFKKSSGITPIALRNRPLLRRDCTKYRSMFNVLSGKRNYNEAGAQPIPVSEIQAYLVACGVTRQTEKDKALRFLSEMDGVFLEYLRSKKKT